MLICLSLSGATTLTAETEMRVGRVFAVHARHIEITGDGIQRLRKGTRLIVKAQKGEVGVVVTETFHTKLNCRVSNAKQKNWISAGDEVYLPGEKKAAKKTVEKKPEPAKAKKTSGSLVDNQDGTISDSATGLLWKKCSEGQNNDAQCSGEAQGVAFCPSADNACNGNTPGGRLDSGPLFEACDRLNRESFAGRTTWRLPSGVELKSLVLCNDGKPLRNGASYCENATGPVIDTKVFPATKAGHYWTVKSYAENLHDAWVVYFYNGLFDHFQKTNQFYVRCVANP